MTRTAPLVLEVQDLRKTFSSRDGDHEALGGISFSIKRGGCVALVGESGSGKTTAARIIAGLETATSGSVVLHEGGSAGGSAASDGHPVQMVFQNPYGSLDPRQRVGAGLRELLALQAVPRSERDGRATDLLHNVGLDERHLKMRTAALSGGQRQRVAIARALALSPSLLVLDEAVSALDVSVQAQVLNLLTDIRSGSDVSYLFISHDLGVVRQISDTCVVLRDGHIVEHGTTANVLDHPQHPYTQMLVDAVPRPGWQPQRRTTVLPPTESTEMSTFDSPRKTMSSSAPNEMSAELRVLLGKTMPEILDNAAAQWGSQVALHEIEDAQRTRTWSEFRDDVAGLRSGLEDAGLQVGEKVGVLLRNQIEFPVVWLALVEAGAVIVPLNPKYTLREIDFVLADAGATWLIGLGDLIDSHVKGGVVGPVDIEHIVAVGGSDSAQYLYADLLTTRVTPRSHQPEPQDVVNIQFTSGTTGLPKGCLLTHEYWVSLGVYGAVTNAPTPKRLLADHPFYYMQNQAYLMQAAVSGGGLWITPGLSRRKFMGWLHEFDIDYAWIDEDMLEFPESPDDRELSLTRAPVAGLPPEAYAPLRERFGIEAREVYASTEVGPGTYVPFDRPDLAGNGSMGICFPHRESKVLDEHLLEVPPGDSGELCIRGPGMMLGYHNREEANAELFLSGGWFRTGDVVTKSEDGQHYYIGRVRDMIRRSGENISAAEVEMELQEMPGVEEAAVVPVPDPDRDEEVKAILVLADGESITPGQVVEWARQRLAPFKVPRYIEFRAELPYTGSGKVHKAALKAEEPFSDSVTDTKASNDT
jgi:ABC-type dipeptide/oligopeptide/nickel transport system ATPase subunit/acyl-CoA synthetase (AMP-forming)/AMP-acid ligase II